MKHRTRILTLKTLSLVVLVALLAALSPSSLPTVGVAQAQTAAPTLNAPDASTPGQISLSWGEVSGAVRYQLWSWDSSAGWRQLGGDDLTDTSYVDSDVVAGRTYHYQVCAFDGGGNRTCSAQQSVMAASAGTLAVPDVTVTVDGPTAITISWDPVPGATAYVLWSWDNVGGWRQPSGGDISGTSYSDTGLMAARTYHYQVKSKNASSESAYSAAVTGTTQAAVAPGAPALRAATTSDTINLSWTPPADNGGSAITGYAIEVSDDGSTGWTALATLGAGDSTYPHSGLARNTEKHYRIRASNSAGAGAWSAVVAATTSPEVPGKPTLVASATSATMISISWEAPADNGGSAVTHYDLHVSTTGTSGWSGLGGRHTTRAYEHRSGLTAGTTRYYRVRANNSAGPGEWSDVDSATTSGAAPRVTDGGATAPELTAVKNTDVPDAAGADPKVEVKLTWETPTDSNYDSGREYQLERWNEGTGSWEDITLSAVTDTSHVDAGRTPGMTYYYRVRAKHDTEDKFGKWDYDDATTDPDVPAAPTLTVTVTGAKSIKLSWNKPKANGSEIIAYYLQRTPGLNVDGTAATGAGHLGDEGEKMDADVDNDDTNDDVPVTQVSALEMELTDSGLAPATEYTYQIYAVNGAGVSAVSATVARTTDTDVPAMRNLAAEPTSGSESSSISLTVTAPDPENTGGSAITGYQYQKWNPGNEDWETLDADPGTDGHQDTTTNTTLADADLTGGTTYYYRVRAANDEGDSKWSEVASAMTAAGAPGKPSLTAVATKSNVVQLTWAPPKNNGGSEITGYEIYFYLSTAPQEAPADTGAPTATATLGAKVVSDAAMRVADVMHFGNDLSTDAATLNEPTATTTLIMPAQTYLFFIRAVNEPTSGAFQRGTWSDAATVTTPAGKPGKPVLLAMKDGATDIDLVWGKTDANNDGDFVDTGDTMMIDSNGSPITLYELRRWDGSNWVVVRANLPAAPQSFKHMDLASGKTYYYSIRARNAAGYGKWSEVASAKTDAGKPEMPVLTAAAMGDKIKLMWTEPHNGGSKITMYELQVSDDGGVGGEWDMVDFGLGTMPTVVNADSPTDAEQQALDAYNAKMAVFLQERMHEDEVGFGKTKYYRIKAMNSSGYGKWSAVAKATTAAGKPDTPELTAAADGANKVKLTWKKPKDGGSAITGYEIEEWDRSSRTWSTLTTPGAGATSWVHAVEPGSTHYYRISAMNSAGSSDPSAVASATTAAAKPGTPVLTATKSGTAIHLTWTKPSDGGAPISGYLLQSAAMSNGSMGEWMEVDRSNVAGTHTSFNHEVGAGKKMYYRIRAMNSAGPGSWSPIVTATTDAKKPDKPVLMVTEQIRAVILTWNEPATNGSAITSYKILVWDKTDKEWDVQATVLGSTRTYTHNVATGTRSFYRLVAVNAEGESDPSTIKIGTAN